jgi:uncharacterized protein YecT (DUF1311 family)
MEKTILRAAVCMLAATVLAAPALAAPADWVLDYTGKSSNAFIWDKRARPLVNARVPATLARDVLSGLGGPPDPVVVVDGRYLRASACVAHACPDKGLFWIDSRTGAGLGAYFGAGDSLRIGSNGLTAASLPAPARRAIVDWLDDNRVAPTSVQFIGRDNRAVALAVADFTPRARFKPPPGGPSFDCGRAATVVEKTICADAGLAKQDLDLAEEVRGVRRGHDTTGAREQVTALQRNWLRARDRACGVMADKVACLDEQYRRQYEVLRNWLPAR